MSVHWRDDSLDEDEKKTLLDDMTSIENASKQVQWCMAAINEEKKQYIERCVQIKCI